MLIRDGGGRSVAGHEHEDPRPAGRGARRGARRAPRLAGGRAELPDRLGELDLVAVDGGTLVFCEVKTCRAGRRAPWDNLHARKRSQVRRMAGIWFAKAGRARPFFEEVRFDAIGVTVDAADALVALDHLEGAF
ncbi:MAG: YraN family protein [Solirubrobacteraceae bacterium]